MGMGWHETLALACHLSRTSRREGWATATVSCAAPSHHVLALFAAAFAFVAAFHCPPDSECKRIPGFWVTRFVEVYTSKAKLLQGEVIGHNYVQTTKYLKRTPVLNPFLEMT